MFSKYHYLDAKLNNAATQYVAFINNQPVGFCAVLHLPHGIVKNLKRCSRLVVLPDYQGIGIGNRLLEWVARHYTKQNYRFTITTTTPALVYSFKKSDKWVLKRYGRGGKTSKAARIELKKKLNGSSSANRITTSWEYNGKV